jgi:uncharacterized BrkB/YihY/UPF0761 family membrane protein
MCGKGGIGGAILGGALALFSGGLSLLPSLAVGASLGTAAIDAPAAAKKQQRELQQAQTQAQKQQTDLIQKQADEKALGQKRTQERTAGAVRAAAVRASASRTASSQLGRRTGTGGVQDAILRTGKAKLGGA